MEQHVQHRQEVHVAARCVRRRRWAGGYRSPLGLVAPPRRVHESDRVGRLIVVVVVAVVVVTA
eukprot:928586-Prymnesium_polylepis.1